jgi:hypothetical protein
MRVDALDLAAAVGGRVGEQREYRLLAFAFRHPRRGPLPRSISPPRPAEH